MATTKTRRRPALERVIATADRLFYEGGLHATGVDLIAAEANVSKATLYTYFETKDDLVAEYLRGRSGAWRVHVRHELEARGGTARERILTVFDLLGEWFTADGFRGCPFINSEAESTPEAPGHQVNLEHRAWVRTLFGGLLTEAGVSSPDRVAPQITLLYDGAMSSEQVESTIDWIDAAKRTVDAVIDAELARSPRVRGQRPAGDSAP
jgi:AcrR family transcriptional regulator